MSSAFSEPCNIDTRVVANLLSQCGRNPAGAQVAACAGGGNNRVFRVSVDGEDFALKQYFAAPGDTRDRMGTEWSFLQFAEAAGIENVPRTYATDRERGVALYDFIDGRKLERAEIDEKAVHAAADFVNRLNTPKARALAETLPDASETRFSIAGHLALVAERLARLRGVPEVSRALSDMLDRLTRSRDRAETAVLSGAAELGLNVEEQLLPEKRCISPSDFGFHNALLRADGSLAFIDFEYAGWDDPAKLVADFFFQPNIPVNPVYHEQFVRRAVPDAGPHDRARMALLRPLFGLRWCFIVLNPFEPAWVDRFPEFIETEALVALRQSRLNRAIELLTIVDAVIAELEMRHKPTSINRSLV